MQTLFSTCWLKRSHPSGQFWITACFKTWTAPASCSTRLYHAVIASMIHFTLAQRESMSWSKFQVWKHWSTMDVRYITRNSFTLSWTHCSTCQANIWRRDKAICHSNAPRFTGFRFFNERNQHLASSEKFIVHKKSLSQEADSHVWWVTPTFDWYMMVCIYIYTWYVTYIYICEQHCEQLNSALIETKLMQSSNPRLWRLQALNAALLVTRFACVHVHPLDMEKTHWKPSHQVD